MHLSEEVSKILRLKRDINAMFSVGQELASSRGRSELCNLGEVEIKWQIFALIPDRKDHVSSLIAADLTKLKRLTIDLDLRVLRSRHHLNLQIWVLDADLLVLVKANDR